MQLKVYSTLRIAFIFQLIVALLCLIGVLLGGGKMIAILAFLGFRPLILSQQTVQDPAPYWHFYYRIGKVSLGFTAISLIILYVSFEFFGNVAMPFGIDPQIWVVAILPYFLLVHSMVGLIYTNKSGTA